MSHDDLQSPLGAYALNALDADEVTAIEDHLAECPRCQAEVAAHRDTVSLLATAGGEAPASLWDRIAAELGQDDAAPGEHLLKGPKVVRLQLRRRVVLPVDAAVATAAAATAAVLGVNAGRLDHRVNVLSSVLNAGGLQQAAAAAVLSPQHRASGRLGRQSPRRRGCHPSRRKRLPDQVRPPAPGVGSDLPAVGAHEPKDRLARPSRLAPQVAASRVEPGVSCLMVTAEPRDGVLQPTSPVLVQGDVLA